RPTLGIIDIAATKQIAKQIGPPPDVAWFGPPPSSTAQPNDRANYIYTNVLLPKDNTNNGRAMPFLVGGYGDNFFYPNTGGTCGAGAEQWVWPSGWLYRGGSEFVEVPITVANNDTQTAAVSDVGPRWGHTWYRENGGYAQDLDNDHVEDINLIYHNRIY